MADNSSAADSVEARESTQGNSGPPIGRFGSFGGVFTPSILTILGVVMYMRVGWVTGEVGLAYALGIVVVAHLISFATGLSIASIATNRTVGAGGAYFMISRALGAPAGAAIGIPLFFAQALSVTFYIVGFVESVEQIWPSVNPVVLGTVTNLALTALSLKSAELAIKTQYVVMAAIVMSLIAFFTGTTETFPAEIEWVNTEGESVATVFAVFFPAVTGIMAGVSMSGDLKDARRSIPQGTLWAIGVGFVIYLAFPIWLAMNMSNERLSDELDAVFKISAVPAMIYAGVWGATISSAIGSILTAPRTLQALAMDGIAPRFLARGYGKNGEPRAGILVTFALAQVGIVVGSLDLIAPVLTMFFLVTYGYTNLACGLQRWASSPSFRPTFNVPALLSLAGAGACFYVMSIIDMLAMFVAFSCCGLLFFVTQRRDLGTTYGDARHGIWAALVRSALHRMRRVEFHPLNWRPNLVIFGGDPNKRSHLLHVGNAIVQDRGIVTYFHLIKGTIVEHAHLRKELYAEYDPLIAEHFPNLFYRVDVAEDIYQGAVQVAQSYGVGNFEANSVMLGWPKKAERSEAYVSMLRHLVALNKSLLLVRPVASGVVKDGKNIHVWWGGLQGNGGLMLLLAFLITAHHHWRNARVTVLTIVNNEGMIDAVQRNLTDVLGRSRIEASTRVIPRNGESIPEIMNRESRFADLAVVGFMVPDMNKPAEAFFERMNTILSGLPTTILVHSARDFEGEPVLFDKPKAAQ